MDIPRVRDITGIRIHQLTLPQSLSLACKLKTESAPEPSPSPLVLGESSRLSSSPNGLVDYTLRRSHSRPSPSLRTPVSASSLGHSGFDPSTWPSRKRSTSSSTLAQSTSTSPLISPAIHPPRTRTSRPRAPTLAGEAIEHALQLESSTGQLQNDIIDENQMREEQQPPPRKIARCFVTLKIPYLDFSRSGGSSQEDEGPAKSEMQGYFVEDADGGRVPLPNRSQSYKSTLQRPNLSTRSSSSHSSRPAPSRAPSSSKTSTSPTLNASLGSSHRPRPSISASSSQSSLRRISSPPAISSSANHSRRSSTEFSSHKSTAHVDKNNRPDAKPGNDANSSYSVKGGSDLKEAAGHRLSSQRQSHIHEFGKDRPPSSGLSSKHRIANGTSRPKSPIITLNTETCHPQNAGHVAVPFYISPVHPPSTHPRFLTLSPETDFAPWLNIEEGASHLVEMEIWVEVDVSGGDKHSDGALVNDGMPVGPLEALVKWTKVETLGGLIDFSRLRQLTSKSALPDNTVQFTFSTDPKTVFYVPNLDETTTPVVPGLSHSVRDEVDGIVERSLRETKMKKGVGVEALHQLVNIQAVIRDTERGIGKIQSEIDRLLTEDVDQRALRRDLSQRSDRTRWLTQAIGDVQKTTREARARIVLRQQEVEERRQNLDRSYERDNLLRGTAKEMEEEITFTDDRRMAMLPTIHRIRAFHVQTLDGLFPITPLSPSTLLYSILQVPLPIPVGPKDPAPPLTLPISSIPEEGRVKVDKIDEKSTATALGYVAMVLQILSGLVGWGGVRGTGGGGGGGGLPYPVTCAGSRSLVRDVVSIMQGHRSFPLYAKGVERYRYEYAVFLLNKNIELLMQESNIRLLDMRHTLPNLKNLLLTLSSPTLPLPTSIAAFSSGSNSKFNSRTSSRQTSRAWSQNLTPTRGSVGVTSPESSVGGYASDGKESLVSRTSLVRHAGVKDLGVVPGTPSPLTKMSLENRRISSLPTQQPFRQGRKNVVDEGGFHREHDSDSE